MKRLYFINDWFARQPGYVRYPLIIVLGSSYVLFTNGLDWIFGESQLNVIISIITYLCLVGWIIFQSQVKNAFIYTQGDIFGIRIDGNRVDFQATHISEVSLDDNHLLKIRRINRIDSFDLSPFREKDRDKLMKYLKEFLSDEVELHSNSIPTV
ncbi:hypothetical protein BST97_00950 [Nonlabens spongiae]|uniref:Uncharacterized protein n=1 Tax=Nonlabens spongiae TaxID=331648 RepID=A0A1W6MGF2_9FLAO|nr:hypothetical protein [Nonlabens spongiae]ARN76684.1 hypothetical protein BST97_00950 [Nonlabens spongiae]